MPVVCKATPETTRVKNNRNRNITIKKVGSIYQPYSDEPFTISRGLGGGGSKTFESGSGANHNVLTGRYIYSNDVGSREGGEGHHGLGDPLRKSLRLVDRRAEATTPRPFRCWRPYSSFAYCSAVTLPMSTVTLDFQRRVFAAELVAGPRRSVEGPLHPRADRQAQQQARDTGNY